MKHRSAAGSRHAPAPGSGFTLIELMVTLAVLAILAALAAPSFDALLLGSRLSSAASELSASAVLARSEAIKRNASVTLCMSGNGSSCATVGSWEQGWVVLQGTTVLASQSAMPAGITVTEVQAGRTSVNFAATGVGSDQARFILCRKTPSVGGQERVVTISATGSVSATRTTNGSCP